MIQTQLFRNTDVQTSQRAAERVPEFKAKHEATIYSILSDNPQGLTAKEISYLTKNYSVQLDSVQVSRRLGAMKERGLIDRREDMVRNNCCVWVKVWPTDIGLGNRLAANHGLSLTDKKKVTNGNRLSAIFTYKQMLISLWCMRTRWKLRHETPLSPHDPC